MPSENWWRSKLSELAPNGDEIIARIEAMRGHVYPLHRLMAELDPKFLNVFDLAYQVTLGFDEEPSPGSLPIRYRELVCATACAIEPAPIEVTARHLRRAFDHGLTEREAIDGFHALLIPSGGTATSNGVKALLWLRENSHLGKESDE